jgi:hypothetical protein
MGSGRVAKLGSALESAKGFAVFAVRATSERTAEIVRT